MDIEKQVCSLELAKRLRELGVKQESLWWWVSRMDGDEETSLLCDDRTWIQYYKDEFGWVRLSAFTVAELGEMLGSLVNSIDYYSNLEKFCFENPKSETMKYINADTEANIRAMRLIYSLEKKLL